MSILWCGGEDIDFGTKSASAIGDTTAGMFRAGYARCSFGNTWTGAHAEFWIAASAITPVSSFWLTARMYHNAMGGGNERHLGLGKNGTNAWLGWGAGSSNTRLAILKYDGTTTTILGEGAVGTYNNLTLQKIDMQVVDYGPAATVRLYMNGAEIVTYTGNAAVLGQTTLDEVRGWARSNASEIIIADEDTRLLSLVTQYPTATVAGNQWTNDHQAVDEALLSDGDTVYTEAADQEVKLDTQNIPAGQFIVKAVADKWRGASGAAGIHTIVPGVIVPGQNGDAPHYGTGKTHTTSWETGERLMQQNPITTNRWQVSEVDAARIVFKSGA